MKEHDYETETLTEHQRRNRDAMSRKMSEMSKLQNTLTNQAKVKCFKVIVKYCRLYRNDLCLNHPSRFKHTRFVTCILIGLFMKRFATTLCIEQ